MTDYPEYERQQELACTGDHVPAYMQAIFDDTGSDPTLGSLQHRIYKDTDAGISIGFELDDGTCIWSGSSGADDPAMVPRVRSIGFSSIVEGSDAEVPLRWLNLLDETLDTPEKAVILFNHLIEETDTFACELWEQEHAEEEEDSDG